MTTLNARANQAYHALVEEAGEDWMGFDHQRDAFEEGWETGYKAAAEDIAKALEDPWRQARPEYQAGLFVAIKKIREIGEPES